jgi:hypothetical protein
MKKQIFLSVILISLMSIANAQWKQVGNLNIHIFNLAIRDSNIFIATGASGVYLCSKNGNSCNVINNGLPEKIGHNDPTLFYLLSTNGNNIFLGSNTWGVYMYQNDVNTWIPIRSGLPVGDITALDIYDSTIFAGTIEGLYVSSNNGSTWIETGFSDFVQSLAISENNIFVGTRGNGIYMSSNNGNTWKTVNNGLPNNTSVSALAISDNNIFAESNGNIYLSSDSGSNWKAINPGFPDTILVWTLAVNGNYLFAGTGNWGIGTGSAIYLSKNNGISWAAVDTGLPLNTYVICIVFDSASVYIGTNNGVFSRFLSDFDYTRIDKMDQQDNYTVVYPNPNNGDFTLNLSNPKSKLHEIIITDIAGKKVFETTTTQKLYNYNGSKLQFGIYVVTVQNEENCYISKMIVR